MCAVILSVFLCISNACTVFAHVLSVLSLCVLGGHVVPALPMDVDMRDTVSYYGPYRAVSRVNCSESA